MPIYKSSSIIVDETLNYIRVTGNDKQIMLSKTPQAFPSVHDSFYHIAYSELDTLITLLIKVKSEVEKLKKEQ